MRRGEVEVLGYGVMEKVMVETKNGESDAIHCTQYDTRVLTATETQKYSVH